MELSTKIKICQVCRFEGRKPKWKSVILCCQHGVCLCIEAREEREACEPILKRKDGSAVKESLGVDRQRILAGTDSTYFTNQKDYLIITFH
jgi:hypothetical protein